MSVENRRHAAAQRTAAHNRKLRLASWLLIVPTLSLFSFSVVAGAAGFGTKPDYAGAIQQLPQGLGVVALELGSGAKEVCSVNDAELAAISSRWPTARIRIDVAGRSVDIVTVSGANDHDLRQVIGGKGATCKLVRVASVFFLPFDAHTS